MILSFYSADGGKKEWRIKTYKEGVMSYVVDNSGLVLSVNEAKELLGIANSEN